MKTRLLGAAVLLALLVLFVPMLFSSKPPAASGDQAVSLAIPPAPDRDLQTKTMSLNPDAAVGAPNGAASTASANTAKVATGASGQLATVDIGSNRPRDVETDAQAGKKPAPTTVVTGSGASSTEPVIPMQNKLPPSAPAAKPPAAIAAAPRTPRSVVSADVASADAAPASGHGSYKVNLSAYASAAGAASLQRRVQALGYPVSSHAITQGGQPRTLVIAGPFETRAAAEAARLKITQSVPGVPARLQKDASEESASAAAPVSVPANKAAVAVAAPTATKSRAGGFAVQLAAMSSQGDATALRDKLRGAGFDGFVDSVQAGGKQLWRVRAGPQTQRADAERIRDQIKAKLGIAGNIVAVP